MIGVICEKCKIGSAVNERIWAWTCHNCGHMNAVLEKRIMCARCSFSYLVGSGQDAACPVCHKDPYSDDTQEAQQKVEAEITELRKQERFEVACQMAAAILINRDLISSVSALEEKLWVVDQSYMIADMLIASK